MNELRQRVRELMPESGGGANLLRAIGWGDLTEADQEVVLDEVKAVFREHIGVDWSVFEDLDGLWEEER